MQANDLVNGAFELFGAYLTWMNVFKLYKDKEIRGVYWMIWIFYSCWGMWNLYYYPSLDQWASFWAGVVMVFGNIAWVILAIKYKDM